MTDDFGCGKLTLLIILTFILKQLKIEKILSLKDFLNYYFKYNENKLFRLLVYIYEYIYITELTFFLLLKLNSAISAISVKLECVYCLGQNIMKLQLHFS